VAARHQREHRPAAAPVLPAQDQPLGLLTGRPRWPPAWMGGRARHLPTRLPLAGIVASTTWTHRPFLAAPHHYDPRHSQSQPPAASPGPAI